MANEATLIYETHLPIQMTCSNSVGIEKGALLKLSDPFTVAAVSANNDIVGGIAAGEKIANDGQTKIAVYRGGIFKVTASGSVTAGDPLGVTDVGAVYTNKLGLTLSGSVDFGIALETATNGETFLAELKPGIHYPTS